MRNLLCWPVLAAGLLGLLLACTSFAPGADRVASAPTVGLNCSPDPVDGPRKCQSVGARLARVEFSIDSTPRSMEAVIGGYASKGIRVQPLAGFYGRIPTAPEAQNLRRWALRFGRGGTFWRNRNDGNLAIRAIEFGNETSYGYQFRESGDWWEDPGYSARARAYALRARDAAIALRGTAVGLLVQGEDGGSSSSVWVDEMFSAVPDLEFHASGWTVHPYGPHGFEKIDRMLVWLDAKASRSVPFSITEWGLATDNGRTLSDNYGYPRDLTYEEAGATLRDVVATWKSRYGARFGQLILYQHADQKASGLHTDREYYFGVLKKYGGSKGAYTGQVRKLIAASGR